MSGRSSTSARAVLAGACILLGAAACASRAEVTLKGRAEYAGLESESRPLPSVPRVRPDRTDRVVLLGFTLYPEERAILRPAALRAGASSGKASGAGAPGALPAVVSLEELPSTNGLLKLGNVILTIATGTVIPFYNRVDHRIQFRRSVGNRRITCTYHVRNHEFFGVLALLAAPFAWPTVVQESAVRAVGRRFARDCGGPSAGGHVGA